MRVNKIEKKIFQEHKKLQGTSEVDTKVKYVKLARSLPTFGVHFFLVKVSSLHVFIIFKIRLHEIRKERNTLEAKSSNDGKYK